MSSESNGYDLMISFISLGAGVDSGVLGAVRAYLESMPDKLSYEAVPQGYEGEGDYRIRFEDIAEGERQAIEATLREMCAGSDLVTIQTGAAAKDPDAEAEG